MLSSPEYRRRVALTRAAVIGAGAVPAALSFLLGRTIDDAYLNPALHALLEGSGGCIALIVALLMHLRVRERVPAHIACVIAGLIWMGIIDLAHAATPVGPAWSWTLHVATLGGGLLFGVVWLAPDRRFLRNTAPIAGLTAALSLIAVILLWNSASALPDPFSRFGYTAWPKTFNAIGGVGYAVSAIFFLARFLDEGTYHDIFFGSHALLLAVAALLFGFSTVWHVEWWLWHIWRLAAYAVVGVDAYVGVNRAFETLRLQNVALETRVAARTAELQEVLASEQRLRSAAETANAAKDRFLTIVSHELRTPLNVVLGWVRLLQLFPDQDGAKLRRALAVIHHNVLRQIALVNDLLDLQRLRTDQMQVRLRPVRMRDVIQRAVDSVGADAVAKGITLDVAYTDTGAYVQADPERLAQVLGNLLGNAVKFTPSEGFVRVQEESGAGDVIVRVTDSGPGLDAPSLSHVFDAFWQADTSDTRRHRGLGVGLAVARGIVQLHGGTLHAEPPVAGQGATFTLRMRSADGENECVAGSDVA